MYWNYLHLPCLNDCCDWSWCSHVRKTCVLKRLGYEKILGQNKKQVGAGFSLRLLTRNHWTWVGFLTSSCFSPEVLWGVVERVDSQAQVYLQGSNDCLQGSTHQFGLEKGWTCIRVYIPTMKCPTMTDMGTGHPTSKSNLWVGSRNFQTKQEDAG